MDHPAIFSATLGLYHPWQVTAVSIAKEQGRLEITVEYVAGDVTCSDCGAQRPCHPAQSETWEHGDFFGYHTLLHARVPELDACICGSEVQPQRPWCRAGSKFVLAKGDKGGPGSPSPPVSGQRTPLRKPAGYTLDR